MELQSKHSECFTGLTRKTIFLSVSSSTGHFRYAVRPFNYSASDITPRSIKEHPRDLYEIVSLSLPLQNTIEEMWSRNNIMFVVISSTCSKNCSLELSQDWKAWHAIFVFHPYLFFIFLPCLSRWIFGIKRFAPNVKDRNSIYYAGHLLS